MNPGVQFASGARAFLLEHRTLLILVLAYVCAGGAVLLVLGRDWPIALFSPVLTSAWLTVTALWVLGLWLRRPVLLRTTLVPHRTASALLVVLLAYPFQITFQSLKQAIGATTGFPWDRWLDTLDRSVHGGPAWHWLSALLDNRWAIHTIDFLYMFWFVALLLVVIWLSWTSRRELRQRALVALALLWIVGGTLGAWLFASAGPCYAGEPAYAELLAKLDSAGPTFARGNQIGLLKLQQMNQWGPVAGISAMPSMHVGLAVLIALISWRRNLFVGAFLSAYAVVMQVGSVMLGWHYAIDGYVGALIAFTAWRVAGFPLWASSMTRGTWTSEPLSDRAGRIPEIT